MAEDIRNMRDEAVKARDSISRVIEECRRIEESVTPLLRPFLQDMMRRERELTDAVHTLNNLITILDALVYLHPPEAPDAPANNNA